MPVDLADAVEVGERHGREGGELDLVGFERAGGRGAVRQHPVDDLVEIGLALAPIVGVALAAGNIRPALYSANLNGPVPTGALLAGLAAMSVPS